MVFNRAFSLGFLADDAWAFFYSQGSWLSPNVESPHYPPLNFVIYYLLFQAFHLNPFPYHVFLFAVVVLNAVLVNKLARSLGLDPWKCWMAGLLVLLNAVAAEAYLWFCIVNTVLMATLVILGLLCLTRFCRGGRRIWAAGYLAMVLLAPMLDGKGLILPLLGFLWERFCLETDQIQPRSAAGRRILKLHLMALGTTAGLLMLRLLAGAKSATIHLPLREKWHTLTATLVSTFFHGVDNHLWDIFQDMPRLWKMVPTILWWLLAALLILGLVSQRGPGRRRFIGLLLLWVVSCLPHTLAANLQFRYFYLPGVFAALVIVELIGSLSARLAGSRRAWLLISMVCLSYLYMDVKGMYLSLDSFEEASRIYAAGIAKIRQRLPVMPPGTRLLLVDFPFYLYNKQSGGGPRPDMIPYVYVFPQALPSHWRLLYGTEDFSVKLVKLPRVGKDAPVALGDPVTPAGLQDLLREPGVVGFRFLPGPPPQFVNLEPGTSRATRTE